MLQLLLEGGQNYADIAALLGIEEQEVRTRAQTALTELAGSDPDANVGLTDYLLGQADPIGRADAVRQLQSDQATRDLAAKLGAQLRMLAPKAQLPDIPGTDVGGTPASAAAPARPGTVSSGAGTAARDAIGGFGERLRGLGSRERRVPLLLGLGAVLILAAVLIATGVIGGGDDDEGGDGAGPAEAGDPVERIEMQPVDGGSGGGQIAIVNVADRPVLSINLFGLEPSGTEAGYMVWLYNSDQEALPITPPGQVAKDGTLTAQAPVPPALRGLMSQFRSLVVSLTPVSEARKAFKNVTTENALSSFTGELVLQGATPTASADAESGSGTAPTPTTPAPPAP